MAVSRMRKFQLFGYSGIKDEIVDLLKDTGALHVTDLKTRLIEKEESEIIKDAEIRNDEVNAKLSQLSYTVHFLSKFEEKPGFLESLVKPKLHTSREETETLLKEIDIESFFEKCRNLENQIKQCESEINKNNATIEALKPWTPLDVPLEQISPTEHTVISLAIVNSALFHELEQSIYENAPLAHLEAISSGKMGTCFLAIFHKSVETDVLRLFKSNEVETVRFDGMEGTPAEIIDSCKNSTDELIREISTLEREGPELVREKASFLILYDHYNEQAHNVTIQNRFAHTSHAFAIEGWIREKDEGRIESKLEKYSQLIEFKTSDPADDEDVPVAFQNHQLIRPFEFVTTLYGRPAYREYDPTPLMAPFFIIFFGLCLTDAGYGITLAALGLLGLKKLKPTGDTEKLFKLMLFGGIVTVAIGALTGGWLGIDAHGLPASLQKILIINPLEEPMKMLNVAFLFGIFHLLFGLSIKMYANFRCGRVMEGILDQALWILFLIAVLPLGYMVILGGEVHEPILSISKNGSLILLVLLILTQGRHQKNPILKVLMGVARLYDIVGYFGDTLSYARLLALGLATSAIAMAINGVAQLALGIPFYIGYLVALLVIIGGHLFNLAVNCLGAFVHSGRLQYLEFFSKFFEGGGVEFRPFTRERKYSELRD